MLQTCKVVSLFYNRDAFNHVTSTSVRAKTDDDAPVWTVYIPGLHAAIYGGWPLFIQQIYVNGNSHQEYHKSPSQVSL